MEKGSKTFKLERQDWQLAAVLLAALFLALLAHLNTLTTISELEKANSTVMGVYDGTGYLQSLDRHLIELVHAQNNFLQSGNDQYVVQAEQAITGIEKDLSGIRRFFQDEITDNHLENLINLVNRKVAFHRMIMTIYRQGGPEALNLFPDLDEGIELRDGILALTDVLRHLHRQHLLETINKKNLLGRELRWISFAGVTFIVLIAAFSIYYLFQTATRRQFLMTNLIESKEKAEKAAFFKEQFIANMSHEIRTPLNAIIGFSNLLQRTELQPKQDEFAHSIRTSSENLLTIVNDILDFSKIEAGALRLEEIPFSLYSLVHSVETMFRFRAKEKQLAFISVIEDNVPDHLIGDPTRLTQILINLMGNAYKFTDKGRILLTIGCEEQQEEKAIISLTVKDTGIGIPKEKLPHIFERFQQASSETTRKYGGAGLGLTITKQLVEVQHGSIHVESEPGQGATFRVKIPYEIAQAEKENHQAADRPVFTQNPDLRLLLVEDNPMNRRVAELLFEEWGFTYEYATNGRIAIEMLKEKTYDLVLMDIQMPEMDGYTAAKMIREELKLQVPIIATTAHAFAGEREKCLQYGMNDYIAKPLREVELLALIREYVPTKTDEIPSTPEAAPTGPAEFDQAYLLEVSKGQPELLREMIDLFGTQTEKELSEISEALSTEDFGKAAAAAHSMKGTVAYMGLKGQLHQLLGTLEQEACKEAPDKEIMAQWFEQIKDLRTAAASELANFLQNL